MKTLLKRSAAALAVTLFSVAARGGAPEWVVKHGKSALYPEAAYLTGYGIARVGGAIDHARGMQLAAEIAKRNLVEKVHVNIRSTVLSKAEERDNQYSSYFSSSTQSTAYLEIEGLEVETHYDVDNEMCHALTYAGREKLAVSCGTKASKVRKAVAAHLEAGRGYEDANDRTKALEEYLTCYTLLRELEETRMVLIASDADPTRALVMSEHTMKMDDSIAGTVRQASQRVIRKPLDSIEDLAWYIVYCLKSQVVSEVNSLLITPFTYRDTGMGSEFSRYFVQALQSKAVDVARWTVIQPAEAVQGGLSGAGGGLPAESGAPYVLTGTYWELPQFVKFTAAMRRVADGGIVSSVDVIVPVRVVGSTHLSLRPDNFDEALDDQRKFRRDEIIGGGLSLEIWTNKGLEDLLFTKGEKMRVYVRVSMPCYVRLVYHLADKNRVLLLDNYYIDDSKVNLVYQFPQEFECDSPYGAEVLQAFASSEKLEAVQTRRVGEYYIIEGDLSSFLEITRGMKKARPQTLQVETRVLVTTIDK